jgi:thiamine biosynthesis lipoprotein
MPEAASETSDKRKRKEKRKNFTTNHTNKTQMKIETSRKGIKTQRKAKRKNRRFFNNLFVWFVVISFLFCLEACSNSEPSRAEFVMGTVCSITLFYQAKESVYQAVFSRLREIDNRMSMNLPDTDVARVNDAAGITPVKVHDDVFEVIQRAAYYAAISNGAFDPTVGPLVALWGIGGENPRVPSQDEIDAVLPLINWRDMELDRETNSVFLKRLGMAIDMGAIAKGYAADEAAAIIRKAGIKRAIIDLGGNILTVGEKKDKSLWKVGLQAPREERGSYFGIVTGLEQSLVTSGDYEKYFESGGIRYHHILSPFDGYPVRNGLAGVTIITRNSIDADALSTTVFALGYEKGLALINSIEDAEAVFVFEDRGARKTDGVDFTLTNGDYRLLE